jgi:hypothetical protein
MAEFGEAFDQVYEDRVYELSGRINTEVKKGDKTRNRLFGKSIVSAIFAGASVYWGIEREALAAGVTAVVALSFGYEIAEDLIDFNAATGTANVYRDQLESFRNAAALEGYVEPAYRDEVEA